MNPSTYKSQFLTALRPMLDLFEYKRGILGPESWMLFLQSCKNSIITNPEQFLGRELPEHSSLIELVEEIFDDFLKDQESLVS